MMTSDEITDEWHHVYQTRLGILGLKAGDKPTDDQVDMAFEEAEAWKDKYMRENH